MQKNPKDLVVLASETENTPELKNYWSKRYEELLNNDLFRLNKKTLEIFESEDVIKGPVTTYGDIVLTNHLKESKQNDGLQLDEDKLQKTIETSVRFLDSLLDKVNFSKDAENLVKLYRKIGIGVADFKNYINKKTDADELKEIDKIGGIISNNSYRASENLAEEKGACNSWNKIKKHLRPKTFEYWYNVENGEVKNGLEMSEEWDQKNIHSSKFEIVPRRNSNLLFYPPDLEWQIWSDRDSHSPKPAPQDQNEENQKDPENVIVEKKEKLFGKPEEKSEDPKIITEDNSGTKNEKAEPLFGEGELVKITSPGLPEFEKVYQVIDVIDEGKGFKYKLTGHEEDIENKLWEEAELEAVDLLEILDKVNSPKQQIEKPEEIDLSTISKKEIEIFANALIINSKNDLLIDKNEVLKLPSIEVKKNQIPEKVLLDELKSKYQIEGKIFEEVGSAVAPSDSKDDTSKMHLGFLIGINKLPEQDNLEWKNIEEYQSLPLHAKVLVDKYKLRNQKLSNFQEEKESIEKDTETLENKINDLVKLREEENIKNNFEIQRLKKQNENLQESIENLKDKMKKESEKNSLQKESSMLTSSIVSQNLSLEPTNKQEASPKKQNNNINNISNNLSKKSMSKYTLKLEQLVKTNTYGDITVVLQYTKDGLKIVNVYGKNIEKELKHSLDTVLGIVNFMLAKSIETKEIAAQLEKEPEDGMHLPLNDLLKIVSESLKEAPENADGVNNSILDEVIDVAKDKILEEAIQKNGSSAGSTAPAGNPQPQGQNKPNPQGGQQPQQNNNQQNQGNGNDNQQKPKQGIFNPFRPGNK